MQPPLSPVLSTAVTKQWRGGGSDCEHKQLPALGKTDNADNTEISN